MEKAEIQGANFDSCFQIETVAEKRLALHLLEFPGAVVRAAESYKPSILADYLFQASQLYSSFYQSSPILKSSPDVRDSRLRLVMLFGSILSKGLNILGIRTPKHI
jgi:arginyl-tRNA synthetase